MESENERITPPAMKGYEKDQFEGALNQFSRWAMRYMDSLDERPVSESVEPGQIQEMLAASPPEKGMNSEQWADVISDIETIVEPGLVHWQSPRFFAYFPCSASMPGIMGDFVSSVLNVNGMLWSTSPAVTEIEMRMLDWCAQMFGLPDAFRFDAAGSLGGGCIQGTASESVLSVIAAARKRKVNIGRDRSMMTVYTSTQAHSSIVKAAMIAGLADGPEDRSRVRLIPTTPDLGMDAKALLEMIKGDIAAGLTPCVVSTTQGTTSTGAMDPLKEIGELLNELPDEDRPWLHVDAAWAGAAAVCPEHQGLLDGAEYADSVCINPHKWLLTNFDCDLFWVRDREVLVDSMSITPVYLRNEQSESGKVVDFRDWHVPLGRRFRAIKLWFVIRHFGVDGLREHIRYQVDLAKHFEQFVVGENRLELSVSRSLALVCFRVIGEGDQRTKTLIERINDRRRVMISHTSVPVQDGIGGVEDRWLARVAVGASSVRVEDIDELIKEIVAVLDMDGEEVVQ